MKYKTIIADPPWQYRNSSNNGAAETHYPTQSIDDICNMHFGGVHVSELATDDAVLFLWATWPMVADALRVVDAWGFEYLTGFPWVKCQGQGLDMFGEFKPFWGTGFWVRGCSEPIFICRRKNTRLPDDFAAPLGLICPNAKHSRKPDSLYEMAELHPGPYAELYARRERPGWHAFGNEVQQSCN